MATMAENTLYERLGGYDAICAATDDLLGRLQGIGDWRAYRRAGRSQRRELELPPAPGVLDALRRSRVYRSVKAR